jgi:DNA topoisomerase I
MKLIISEKEIAAKRIAQILSGDGVSEKKVYGVPVHYFKTGGQEYEVIGLRGHILKVDYPKEFSNWFKVDPIKLIDVEPEKAPVQKKIIQALKKVAEDVSEVIVATDYDREGELIGYDAVQVIQELNSQLLTRRAKFSAITVGDINKSFSKPGRMDLNLAFAGRARQDIDLIWGAVLTRFISLTTYQVKDRFLSVGRVQTPTLALIVDREMEIKNFKPAPYRVIKIKLKTDEGEEFEAYHRKKKFTKMDEAERAFARIGTTARVMESKESVKNIRPPVPLNTTGLIVGGNFLGFTASRTISLAESLYMNGYISYPRTDNTVYPPSIDLIDISGMLGRVPHFRQLSEEILSLKKIKPSRGGKKTTDHPPVYPTSPAGKSDLSADEWKLYEFVVRRFASTLLPAASYRSISAKIDAGGETFIATGSTVIEPGWTRHYPYYRHQDVFVPGLEAEQILKITGKHMEDKYTKPPPRYSQGKLVQKMDELGLGTKATRHSIIQTLLNRGYVKGSLMEPSEKAIALIKMLKKHAGKISTPDMTSELEMYMDGIVNGDETRNEVVDRSRNMLRGIMETLEKEKEEISREIKKGIKEDLVVGKCPVEGCGGNLIVRVARTSKKRFIGCSAYPQCRTTFSLPQKGLLLTTRDLCKHCGYPVVKIINKGRRPWNLCINPDCPGKDEKYKNYNNKKQNRRTDSPG